MSENISALLMVALRYAMSNAGVSVFLVTAWGLSETDADSVIFQLALLGTSAIIALAPPIYAMIKRPTAKAMETAKAVDQQVPKGEDVVIKTPAGVPDIVVHSTEKKP